MIDLKILRRHKEEILSSLKARHLDLSLEQWFELDREKREIQLHLDQLSAEKNRIKGEENLKDHQVSQLYSKVRKEIKQWQKKEKEVVVKWEKGVNNFPNLLASGKLAPPKKVEVEKEVRVDKNFSFPLKNGQKLAEKNRVVHPSQGVKMATSLFVHYPENGAPLVRSLINFMIDLHSQDGYREVFTPYLVNEESVFASGHLPKFAHQMYRTDKGKLFLIPTGEVPLLNLHRGEILAAKDLPLKYVTYTPCFRKEAGAKGEGLFRLHQFDKVELFQFAFPDSSEDTFAQMVAQGEKVLAQLGLPYRIVKLPPQDLAFAAACTWDLEVYCPASKQWLEVSSISLCTDFQARRAKIRFRQKGKVQFPHTLNASGLAIPRLILGIMENCQRKDGAIDVPPVLQKYLGRKIL